MRPPVQLDAGLGISKYPAVASEGYLTAAVWLEDGTNNLYCSASSDNGATWSTATQIDDGTGSSKWIYDYNLTVHEGSIYFAWRDQRNGTKEDTYFTVSNDDGLTWSADLRLEDGDVPGATDIDSVKIAAEGTSVYVLQRIDVTGGEGLFLLTSNDRGATWGPLTRVDNGGADVDYEAITATETTIHIAWCDNRNSSDDDLFYSHTHDDGATWMMDNVQLDGSGPGVGDIEGTEIHLSAAGTSVTIAWLEDELPTAAGDEEVHVIVSADGGHTFGTDTTLMTGADADNHFASAGSHTVGEAIIAVAWEDNRTGADEAYVAVSSDFGATWAETMVSSAGAGYPIVRSCGHVLSVAFTGGGFPENPMLATSEDNGATWTVDDMALATQAGDADYVEMSMNEAGNVTGVWLSDDTSVNQIYAGGIDLGGPSPGGPNYTATGMTAGNTATLRVDGCEATSNVLIGYSLAGPGPTNTPYGSVDMSMPIKKLPVMACDPNGAVVHLVSIPPSAGGVMVWTQAAELQASGTVILTNSLVETL
jgi:hypothetical protein